MRQTRSAGAVRSAWLHVRVTPAEKAHIEREAERANLTMSRLLVESVSQSRRITDRAVLLRELFALRREIRSLMDGQGDVRVPTQALDRLDALLDGVDAL